MEVLAYLRSRPLALAVLVIVPLIAAVAAFFVVRDQAAQYASTTQVTVPAGSGGSTGNIAIFASNFSLALKADETVRATSQQTGMSPSSVSRGLQSQRLGASSLIQVQYTGPSAQKTGQGAVTAAQQALLVIARRQSDQLSVDVDRLTARYQAASAAVAQYQEKSGVLYPVQQYEDLTSQLVQAALTKQRALAAGDSVAAAAAQALTNSLLAQQQQLAEPAQQMRILQQDQSSAAGALQNAQQKFGSAQAAAAPTAVASLVAAPVTGPASDRSRLIQAVVAAAVIAFLLSLVVVVGPDLLRRRGTPRHRPERVGRATRPLPPPSLARGDGAPAPSTDSDAAATDSFESRRSRGRA